ncbi:MAG TPA: MFS transporter [Burkholderiales bacterium]
MVVGANFLAVAARMSLVTFLGIYFVRHAGIALATVGVAFLCESAMRGLAAPMFGALSDRIGRRALLVGSALATAAVLPSFLLVDGPRALLVWSLALGLTGAVNMPVASALLLDLAPAQRRQSVLALNYTGMSVAYTLGVVPAGYVAQQGYGALAATAALGYVLVAALYLAALRGPLPLERLRGDSVLRDTVSAFRDARFLGFAALALAFPLGMGMVVTASPVFGAELGLGEGYIGLVLGGNSILVALGALPAAARLEPLGPFRVLGAAAFMVSAAFLCYALVPDPAWALLAGTVVFSLGEIVFSSAVPAAVARLAPAGRRGAYQGGWALVSSFAMGSALALSGLLTPLAGWSGAWLAYAAATLAAAIGLLRLRGRFMPAS